MTGPGGAADVAYTDQRVGHPQLRLALTGSSVGDPQLRRKRALYAVDACVVGDRLGGPDVSPGRQSPADAGLLAPV